MKMNLGLADQFIRMLIAAVIAVLYAFKMIDGYTAYALLTLAIIFILTTLFGFCPLYKILGIKTTGKEAH